MDADDDRLMSIGQVLAMVDVSKSTLYKMIAAGHFPRPIRVGLRGARWWYSEVAEWLKSCPRATEANRQ